LTARGNTASANWKPTRWAPGLSISWPELGYLREMEAHGAMSVFERSEELAEPRERFGRHAAVPPSMDGAFCCRPRPSAIRRVPHPAERVLEDVADAHARPQLRPGALHRRFRKSGWRLMKPPGGPKWADGLREPDSKIDGQGPWVTRARRRTNWFAGLLGVSALGFAAVWAATGNAYVAALALWVISVPVLVVAVVVLAGVEEPADDQPQLSDGGTASSQRQDRDC
jgi:hypothetical protein